VRAASLAARFGADGNVFERSAAAEPIKARADAHIPRTADAAGDMSILVAEDNEINALIARALLTKMGHRPTIVASGAAAYDSWAAARAAGTPYDLILMDVHMPVSDGIEGSRRIRAAEAAQDAPRTPIVALTANAFAEDREACLQAGMDGYLIKPLDREQLAAALATVRAAAAIAA
jgi:CheY-like chemotaxis protein